MPISEARVIDWDGTHLPDALRSLPPGRYVLAALDVESELAPEEEAAVLKGLREMEAGDVATFDEVVEELRRLDRSG
jgi:predicted transcriptional regulator